MPYDNDAKELLTIRLRSNIENQEWDKLIEAMPIAEEASLPDELLEQGWFLIGEYLSIKSALSEAIYAYNKARKHNPASIQVFDKLISTVGSFIAAHRDIFNKTDLEKFITPLNSIMNYHYAIFPDQRSIIEQGEQILNRVNYLIRYIAPDSDETKISYQVQQIVDSLDKDVPMEQVHQDIAKILTRLIRRNKKSVKGSPDNSGDRK